MAQHTKKQPRLSASKRASLLALVAASGHCLAVTRAHAAPAPPPAVQKPGLPPATLPRGLPLSVARTYPFRDAYAFVPYGDPTAHALLSVAKTRVYQARIGSAPSDGIFEVDIRIYNDSGDQHRFYNVAWNRLIPLAGCLALYDSQKRYVCDLLEAGPGSRATVGERNWLAIPASGYMGKTVYASLPYPSYVVVPAGTYYLQVIYHPDVIQPPSEAKRISYDDHAELFRSNVVPITVVDQPPAPVAPPK